MAFTKLDSGITDSTIWQAPDATRIVWITMLAMADQNGYVGASMPGLAARARVSLEACITAVQTFLAPDEWSRTREFDGRRIVESEGGWTLLNHARYRESLDVEKRRERSRIAMQKLRAKRAAELTVNKVSHGLPPFAQAEAEAEAEAEKKKPKLAPSPSDSAPAVVEFPTTGPVKSWGLTAAKLDEYRATYETLDVLTEAKKAAQWCRDNPGKRKTARGMPAFLGRWLAKAADSPRTNGNGSHTYGLDAEQIRAQLFAALERFEGAGGDRLDADAWRREIMEASGKPKLSRMLDTMQAKAADQEANRAVH